MGTYRVTESRSATLLQRARDAAGSGKWRQAYELLSEAGDEDRANVFRREGDYWRLAFDGRVVHLRHLTGHGYLARLLACPGRELHVLDLAGGRAFELASDPPLDRRARDAYRRRLAEIDEAIAEATAAEDAAAIGRGEAERESLARELARAVGLGGRDRRCGSASERARASVTRAMRRAMGCIGARHPAAGEHLARAVRTGTYCSYLPDPRYPPAWRL